MTTQTEYMIAQLSQCPLDEWLADLLKQPEQVWQNLHANFDFRHRLYLYSKQLCDIAQQPQNSDNAELKLATLTEIHQTLELIYNQDFAVPSYENLNVDTQPLLRDLAAQLEAAMLSAEYALIDLAQINGYPENGAEYVKWLQRSISKHSSSVHSVYNEYLSNQAGADELAYYFAQETTLDPRFDDILALMQIGNQVDVKLEIAQNYWDEMGNGVHNEVHSRLFAQALKDLSITPSYIREHILPGARISGNLSACLALSRRHYYKAIGYFGVTEYLAPRRFKHVVKAWKRNGLPEAGIVYHDLHIGIDTVHAKAWLNKVIAPLIDRDPRLGEEIALGAFIRMNSSQRYLDQLLEVFDTKGVPRHIVQVTA